MQFSLSCYFLPHRFSRQKVWQTLKTWKASNCMLRDFSFSIFIISFRLSGFDMYLVITWNKLHTFRAAEEKLNTELCPSFTIMMFIIWNNTGTQSLQTHSLHLSLVLMFTYCNCKDTKPFRICGADSGGYEKFCLLGYNAV
jgi:hypothetical protein